MLDTVILALCGANLFFMAAWMTVGALENLFHPFLNETYTAEVMDMARMREDYPEAYVHVAYRRLTNTRLRKWLFGVIVAFELLAMVLLWAAAVSVLLALLGAASVATALTLGLVGAGAFSSVWAGFLVAGNYFCYWFGHEGGQNTHFQMLQWGMLSTIVLIAASVALA
ncbi:DUF2165 family protein [Mameliella alba]|uniref:DUF2165 family protein n=1 Tax=Mameliella alba TaxID=561184 RepID=UPI001431F0EA|nr:DUF2165 family protein [Mameliella alba]